MTRATLCQFPFPLHISYYKGGILQATPHAVKGCCTPLDSNNDKLISRESFAVFLEPE